MNPLASEQQVIDAAETLARTLGDNPNHTVAAAVMDIDGRIHEAVNVYHFTGGPCAELVALGVAATTDATQLLTIAAAGDGDRGLIPPCGRCRQVLIDQHPDILVALPGDDGPEMHPVRSLLPGSYLFPDPPAGHLVRFNRRYTEAVLAGEKTSTIRWDETHHVGRATFVFEDHPEFAHVDGEITAIETVSLSDLDDAYAAGLRSHYPTMPDDAQLSRLHFRVDTM